MAFTAEEVYQKFLVKINKNSTQYNISCDRGRFVLLINEAKHNWAKDRIKQGKGSIDIENIQDIIKDGELLNPVEFSEFTEFKFEADYYETIGGFCIATQGIDEDLCQRIVRLREIKNQDKQLLYFDDANEPSFDYEWSYYTIQSNKLRVYRKDFRVISANIEFYEVLPEFDIEGYTKLDESASENKPFPASLSDYLVDEIIGYTALEFMRIYENQVGFQLTKEGTK